LMGRFHQRLDGEPGGLAMAPLLMCVGRGGRRPACVYGQRLASRCG